MKSYVAVLVYLFILAITKSQCVEDEESSYFEIGQRNDAEVALGYTKLKGTTDLRNNSDIEIRYVALDAPVSFIEMQVNATVKTFQFIYLNESSCIIRFRGLKSPDPLVAATVKIYNPELIGNEKTGVYEYNCVNKTMVLQLVKVKEVNEPTTEADVGEHVYPDAKVIRQQTYGYDYSQYYNMQNCATCASSAFKTSITLLCCVVLINFSNLF